jgi:hypothetical protein
MISLGRRLIYNLPKFPARLQAGEWFVSYPSGLEVIGKNDFRARTSWTTFVLV